MTLSLRSQLCRISVIALATGLLTATAACGTAPDASQPSGRDTMTIAPVEEDFDVARLQPGVAEYIRDNFLGHKAEFPDPDEPVGALELYMNHYDQPDAIGSFEVGLEEFPNSRHLHAGLALGYWDRFILEHEPEDAARALVHMLRAARAGLENGHVRYLGWIREMALGAERPAAALELLDDVVAEQPAHYEALLQRARLKSALHGQDPEEDFQVAMAVHPHGNFDAATAYAEWLSDLERFEDVLSVNMSEDEPAYYLDFLHGHALEMLGRLGEAAIAYTSYEDMSTVFPAPIRYQIPESATQVRVVFTKAFSAEGVPSSNGSELMANLTSGQISLSWVTSCESGGEPTLGQWAVAYSVRHRALRGTIKVNNSTCVAVSNGNGTLDSKYSKTICQTSQYSGVSCSSTSGPVTKCTNVNSRSNTSDQVAYSVWNGTVPDPTPPGGNYCPGTDSVTPACLASCAPANTSTWNAVEAHSFLAQSTCSSPWACASSSGKVCFPANSGKHNCFFRSP